MMRNKLFLIATLLFVAMTAWAQGNEKYENKFLSINIPQGWTVQPMQIAATNADIIVFTNADGSNTGLVICMEMEQDPMNVIETQKKSPGNIWLNGATLDKPMQTKFLGKPATAVNFSNQIMGKPCKGTIYAFNDGGCCHLALGAYQSGQKSMLPQIWRSLKWKNYVRKVDDRPLDVVMQEYCEGVTDFISQYGEIKNGTAAMTAISYDANERCLTRTYRDDSVAASDYDESTLQSIREYMDNISKDIILQDAKNTEILQRCVDAGITFKMIYYDKNNTYFHTIKVTAEQYK